MEGAERRAYASLAVTGWLVGLAKENFMNPSWLGIALVSALTGAPQPAAEPVAQTVPLMAAQRLAELKTVLPKVADPEVARAFTDRHTIWYDEESMPMAYQDNVPPIVGVRTPDSLMAPAEFFEGGRFRFPFGHTGGTHRTTRTHTAKFLVLPRSGDRYVPVVWWRDDVGYHWVFPKGTLIGEVLLLDAPNGEPFVYEIRTRRRDADGWQVDALRPFPTAGHLASALEKLNPKWADPTYLKKVLAYLRDPKTIRPNSLNDQFGAFQSTAGVDLLPPLDEGTVRQLLRTTTFRSAQGESWKRDGKLECYAPTSDQFFSVVPANYDGGMIAVDEVSCQRCHKDTGRAIGEFLPDQILYGTVWGSDQTFSWHPFDPESVRANEDGMIRRMRQEFVDAGVIEPFDGNRHDSETYTRLSTN
jgi:hypothetical protein